MTRISRIGLDASKAVFTLRSVDQAGKSPLRLNLRRAQVIRFFKKDGHMIAIDLPVRLLTFPLASERPSTQAPPFAELAGVSVAEVEEGRIVLRTTPAEYHCYPIGTVRGGVLATLLDSVIAGAVHTILPKGRTCTSLEINVN